MGLSVIYSFIPIKRAIGVFRNFQVMDIAIIPFICSQFPPVEPSTMICNISLTEYMTQI